MAAITWYKIHYNTLFDFIWLVLTVYYIKAESIVICILSLFSDSSFHPATAIVVVLSQFCTLSITLWTHCTLLTNFVNGYMSTLCFTVCHWTHSQTMLWFGKVPLLCVCKSVAFSQPEAMMKVKAWLSDNRISYSNAVDHRNWEPVHSTLCSYVDNCHALL